jgi:hypothetical protein
MCSISNKHNSSPIIRDWFVRITPDHLPRRTDSPRYDILLESPDHFIIRLIRFEEFNNLILPTPLSRFLPSFKGMYGEDSE